MKTKLSGNHTVGQLSLLRNDPQAISEKDNLKQQQDADSRRYEGYDFADLIMEIALRGSGIKEVEIYVNGGL